MERQPILSLNKKDFEVQTFRAGGKGGQHQNKRDTGVRIIHPDSGARAESREHRSQRQNKTAAFRRLTQSHTFRRWLARKTAEKNSGETVEQAVSRQMAPENIRTEVRDGGHWVPFER